MKASIILLLASAAASLSSATPAAPVYIFDRSSRSSGSETPSTDPETARLLLAYRLGLSQYHSLKEAGNYTLQFLNEFGGRPKSLFDDGEKEDETRSVLVIVEGVEKPDSKGRVLFRICTIKRLSEKQVSLTRIISQHLRYLIHHLHPPIYASPQIF